MGNIKKTSLHMLEMYDDAIARGQNKTFAIYQKLDGKREEYSYNYVASQAELLIKKIKDAGLKKGDRIGVIASLRPWWYSLTYACLKAGYIMVCVDPNIPTKQMQDMLVQTDVRAVFTTINNIHLPDDLYNRIPIYSIEEDFPLINKCKKVNTLLKDSEKLPDDTFFILFSSGTSGEYRKAVLLKNSTISLGIEYSFSTSANIYKNKPIYHKIDCDLMLFPPYHIAGLLCTTYDLYMNTKVIMLERLTPNNLVSALNDLKPDNICTVPTMLNSFYKKILTSYTKNPLSKVYVNTSLKLSGYLRKNYGINVGLILFKKLNTKAFGGNMKSLILGASPFDEVANTFFLNMGFDVSMTYGLTELGAPLAVTGEGYYPGTTGRAVKHTNQLDIRIVNKDDTGKGEVEVLSPYRMISYLNPKDNDGCFTNDGYFKTGDLGYFDENDCLVICGRIKETMVLRNGEKILPEEIEAKYQGMDSIEEVVAFKIPGEGGCDDFALALIKNKEKNIPDEPTKVRVYQRAENLPPMYRPKEVYVLEEFPLSSSHKVQRFRLAEMAINGQNNPITDASMIPIDDDEVTSQLRRMLIKVGGQQWKNEKLTQGLYLNLDSLATVDLYVAIQDKWNIDLFQSSKQLLTFGDLLDAVNNFDVIDKKNKNKLDLSKYPLSPSIFNRLFRAILDKIAKHVWGIKAVGLDNLPKDTSFIICSNHRTEIDAALISAILPKSIRKNTCVVGKSDLVNNKFSRIIAKSYNVIPVDRAGNSIKTLDRCNELLLEGKNILIFPEGSNVQNNTKPFPLKEGSARMAVSTNKVIIPVYIAGVGHRDKEIGGFKFPPSKEKITIKFGKQIEPNGLAPIQLNEILSKKLEELE